MLTVDQQKTMEELETLLDSISGHRRLYGRLFYQKGFLLSFLAQILHEDRQLHERFKQQIDIIRSDVETRH